jgi:hypothetical protein
LRYKSGGGGVQLLWDVLYFCQILQVLTRLRKLAAQTVEEKCKFTAETTTPWPETASELYRPSDCRLSAKLVPTFADRGCQVVCVTDPYGRILDFYRPKLPDAEVSKFPTKITTHTVE